jgi:hypothetical protein
MTTNNGTIWTPVTVTAGWTFVEIPSVTLANPVCGFRLGTSGDSIAIDVVNNETGTSIAATATKSSPIITTSSTVSRSSDDLQLTGTNFSSVFEQAEGTIVTVFSSDNLVTDSTLYNIDDGTTGQANQIDVRLLSSAALRARVRSAAGSSCDLNPGVFAVGADAKLSFGYKRNDFGSAIDGGVAVTDTAGEVPATTMIRLTFGQRGTTGVQCVLHLKSFTYYSVKHSSSVLQTLATP